MFKPDLRQSLLSLRKSFLGLKGHPLPVFVGCLLQGSLASFVDSHREVALRFLSLRLASLAGLPVNMSVLRESPRCAYYVIQHNEADIAGPHYLVKR